VIEVPGQDNLEWHDVFLQSLYISWLTYYKNMEMVSFVSAHKP
jgi:hypothetical protein